MNAVLLAEQERLAGRLAALVARASGWIDPPLVAIAAAPPVAGQAAAPIARAPGRVAASATERAATRPPSPPATAGSPDAAGATAPAAASTDPRLTPAVPALRIRRLRVAAASPGRPSPGPVEHMRSPTTPVAASEPERPLVPTPRRTAPIAIRPEHAPAAVPPEMLPRAPAAAAPPAVLLHGPRAPAGAVPSAVVLHGPLAPGPHEFPRFPPRRAVPHGAGSPDFAARHAFPLFADAELEERIAALLDDALTEAGTEAGPDLR
jgi:hypothetical protein